MDWLEAELQVAGCVFHDLTANELPNLSGVWFSQKHEDEEDQVRTSTVKPHAFPQSRLAVSGSRAFPRVSGDHLLGDHLPGSSSSQDGKLRWPAGESAHTSSDQHPGRGVLPFWGG